MTIIAVGGEADCFEPVSGQAFAFESTAGRFEANISRNALKVTQGTSEVNLTFGDVTDAWIHAYLYQESITTEADYIVFRTEAGDPVYKIGINADGSWSVYKYDGASWGSALASSTSSVVVLEDAAAAIDIHITMHASTGVFDVYKNGTQIITFSGDTSADEVAFGLVHFRGLTTASREMNVSQVIVADENTIGFKLVTLQATGAGANSDWTGDYTAIDEADLNTGDFIETTDVDDVSTFAAQNLPGAVSTYSVKAVAVGVRASIDAASSVGDIQAALRVSGTNYFSTDLGFTADSSHQSKVALFATNPNTSAAWANAAVDAMEIGVKSVA